MSTDQKVMEVIADTLGVELSKVELDTMLDNDFSMDEMHQIELVMAIEEEFSIDIPDEDAAGFEKVSDITQYISHRIC